MPRMWPKSIKKMYIKEEYKMNTQALFQAMQEKEMIQLITELFKYRQTNGREKFIEVIKQMESLLEINKTIN